MWCLFLASSRLFPSFYKSGEPLVQAHIIAQCISTLTSSTKIKLADANIDAHTYDDVEGVTYDDIDVYNSCSPLPSRYTFNRHSSLASKLIKACVVFSHSWVWRFIRSLSTKSRCFYLLFTSILFIFFRFKMKLSILIVLTSHHRQLWKRRSSFWNNWRKTLDIPRRFGSPLLTY